MMAAIAAAGQGASVTICERNDRPGRKLLITGKGRCNVTCAVAPESFYEHISHNHRFLYSAFDAYDNNAVHDFFTSHGCELKRERGDRYFPVSDRAQDVVDTLRRELKRLGVSVVYGSRVTGILTRDEDKLAVRGVRLSDGSELDACAVIVCTGGVSYSVTGSTGDGYDLARGLGLRVTDVRPALVPLSIEEPWCVELQGLSLRNVGLTLRRPGRKKPVYEGFGEMMFTHYGVSGPLVLSASCAYEPGAGDDLSELHLDLKPALTVEQLDARILRDLDERHNKQFKNSLDALLPAKLIPVVVELSGIAPDKRSAEVNRAERHGLAVLLKDMVMHVTGLRSFDEAVITRGGVDVRDIDPHTMEARSVRGLYFAGEVLDVDAVTGGYNLQIAWSTGHLAGTCAAQGSA